MNNGCSTGYFPLYRGTRQGIHYLCVLLEILFIQVRSDTDILGFTIEDMS